MKLANAAKFFDKTVAEDAYDATATFMCQVDPQVYFKIDGVAVKKRTMACSPSVVVPSRQVVNIENQAYLVGSGTPDMWKGTVIRNNYVLQGADDLATLNTIAAELAGTAGTQAFAALVFSKYLPEGADSSKYPPQYQIFMSGTESAPADSLVNIGTRWFLVKDSYIGLSGLLLALVNEIKGTVFETITANSEAYDPVTDAYTPTPATIKVLRVRWQEHFTYLSKAQIEYFRGDEQVFILKADMTPNPGDTLVLSDGTWRVLDAQDDGLIWSCHVRR